MRGLRVPRLEVVLVALLAVGCVSVAPGPPSGRVLRGEALSVVFAAALDALADLGAHTVTARPHERGGVLTARVRTVGSSPAMFDLEVSVLASGEGVRVAVSAEPAEAGPSPLRRLGDTPGGTASRSGCGCPAQEPLGSDLRAGDTLERLSQSRRLVRVYLGIFDTHLR